MIHAFRSFFGGIHPDYRKELSSRQAVQELPLPAQVIVPLIQHIGQPCEAVVAVGDTVKTGQVIGESEGFVSARVHASLSGTVTAILMHYRGEGVAVCISVFLG